MIINRNKIIKNTIFKIFLQKVTHKIMWTNGVKRDTYEKENDK